MPVAGEAVEIAPRLHLTGELGDDIKELALVVETGEGLIVITGCAHPSVVVIVRRARQVVDSPVHLVMGGFHLGNSQPTVVETVVDELRKLGVARVGPGRCTGEGAIAAFERAWGEGFVALGAGRVIEVP